VVWQQRAYIVIALWVVERFFDYNSPKPEWIWIK